jgi:hypothetical protein
MSNITTSEGAQFSMPALPTLEGSTVDVKMLLGKKVLLFMWGSW